MTASAPSFRLAAAHDAALVAAISAEAYGPAYRSLIGTLPKPAVEDYAPRIARGEVWLAVRDGEALGVLVLERFPDYLAVYSLAVRPASERAGIGRALLRFADGRARAERRDTLRLFTNARMARNLAIYRASGFIEIGRRPHPSRPGETLVDLEKRIAAEAFSGEQTEDTPRDPPRVSKRS